MSFADPQIPAQPSPRTLLVITLAAIVAALLIVFVGVIPAEYGHDPTGLGKLTGISRLWSQSDNVVTTSAASVSQSRSFPGAFRDDVIEVPLKGAGDMFGGERLEYKVHVRKGGVLIYSWDAPGIAATRQFYSEFHGEQHVPGKPLIVVYYRKMSGASDNGTLTAPFDGIHGWYFENKSKAPVTVKLHIAGFYTLIKPGDPGNEIGLEARQVI